MNLDAAFKRYYPAIVLALIALAAYLQASGIGEMVASSLSAPGDHAAAAPAPASLPDRDRPSAMPILKRNPFDSKTGPLDGSSQPEEEDDDEEPEPPAPGDLSLDDPPCSFGRVTLIADSDEPEWSFAAVETQGTSKLRRVGDEINGHRLEALSWDRVWFAKGNDRCQMKMGESSQEAPKAATPAPRPKRRSTVNRSDRLPPELAAKITRVSDTEFNVERSVVDEILDNQAQLMRRTQVKPVKEGDRTTGLEVSRIRAGSLLDTLGLQNGDEIRTINGFELTNPQKALEAYGRLRAADRLTVQVVRGGQPVTLEFNIQ